MPRTWGQSRNLQDERERRKGRGEEGSKSGISAGFHAEVDATENWQMEQDCGARWTKAVSPGGCWWLFDSFSCPLNCFLKWNPVHLYEKHNKITLQICPPLPRPSLTRMSPSRWWSPRILPATSSSTPTGPALSRTKESSLSKGRSSQYLWMRSISLPSYHFTPFRGQDFDLTEFITYGDIYPNALDHFCAWVEEVTGGRTKKSQVMPSFFWQVLVPIFRNEANMLKYPHCVSYDIKKQVSYNDPWSFQHCDDHDQVHELATAVFQIRGLIKGRTLLPFPQVCL